VLRQVVGRAAAGDDLNPELGQPGRELGQAGLVERGQEGTLD
jgi:hypothetical protein